MSAAFQDLYGLLGLPFSASVNDVNKAFRSLSSKHHPDKLPPDEKAAGEARFKVLVNARDVLVDPASRKKYDRQWQSHYHGHEQSRYETNPKSDHEQLHQQVKTTNDHEKLHLQAKTTGYYDHEGYGGYDAWLRAFSQREERQAAQRRETQRLAEDAERERRTQAFEKHLYAQQQQNQRMAQEQKVREEALKAEEELRKRGWGRFQDDQELRRHVQEEGETAEKHRRFAEIVAETNRMMAADRKEREEEEHRRRDEKSRSPFSFF